MTQIVNLLIGALVISAICVYVLILRRMKRKHEQSDASENKISERKPRRGRATFNRVREPKDLTQEKLSKQSKDHNPKCSFYVGYLGTLAKGSTPPEECSTCPDGALCTIVPKKPIQPKPAKKTTKNRAKRKSRPKRKKTEAGQTRRRRTKKKPRGKAPPS